MKKTNIAVGLVIALSAGALFAGNTIAYLTDYDTKTNEFTIGSVKVNLEEPDWKPEEHPHTAPNETLDKNPYIVNTGENDFYGYISVSIPMENVITTDKDGNREEAALKELFTYQASPDWTLIDSYEKDKMKTRIYTYNKILEKGEKSTELFNTVTLINLIEGQLDKQTMKIPVKAYAIQTEGTGEGKETVPEQAQAAFQKYINQNKESSGAVIGK